MKISYLLEIKEQAYKWCQHNTSWQGMPHVLKFTTVILFVAYWLFSVFNSTKDNVIKLPEVIVQKVTTKTLPMTIKVPSSLITNAEVLIRTRIDGQIKSVHFQEGQYVNENDLLFKIDDDLLKTQLEQAKANVEKDQAQLEQAKKNLVRNKMLLKKQIVTKEAIDQFEASVKANQGMLDADQALADGLELQISYAQIKAPISGIAGFVKVKPGSFVRQTGDANLVSVAQINPIEAIFEIPEKYLANVLNKGIENLEFRIFDVNEKEISNPCKALAIDQGVDAKSGVFSLKVTIENSKMHLRPGMSITGIIKLGDFENVTTIPVQSLLSAQDGSYVFVYNQKNHKIQRQVVKVADTVNSDVVITSGLKPDQLVVTEGQIHIKDNMEVKAKL